MILFLEEPSENMGSSNQRLIARFFGFGSAAASCSAWAHGVDVPWCSGSALAGYGAAAGGTFKQTRVISTSSPSLGHPTGRGSTIWGLGWATLCFSPAAAFLSCWSPSQLHEVSSKLLGTSLPVELNKTLLLPHRIRSPLSMLACADGR